MSRQHPLDDALDEAELAGAPYEVPVALVRTRVRRRRGLRTAARGGAALAAVGAVALVAPFVRGVTEGVPALQADWPAAFQRCGEALETPVPVTDAPLDVTVEPATTVAADRLVLTTTRIRAAADAVVDVGPGPSEVVLLDDDGVVVAVAVPVDRLEVDLRDVPTQGPQDDVVFTIGATLVACAPYLEGTGDDQVPAGRYEVVVVQTVRWVAPDGTAASLTVAQRGPVTVDDGPPVPTSPGACGTDASALAALVDPEANPFPVTLDAAVPRSATVGTDLRLTVTAVNEGTEDVTGTTGHPHVVLTRDGRVVGVPGPTDDRAFDASLPPGGALDLPASSPLHDCTTLGVGKHATGGAGEPLPPGDYEVWVTLEPRYRAPGGAVSPDGGPAQVLLVGGPWPLTLG